MNKIIKLQEILMNEIKRLDDDALMNCNGANEISRSNALTNDVNTYLKAVNVNLRIKEVAQKNEITKESLNKELGILDEK